MFNELERECIIEALKSRLNNCTSNVEILSGYEANTHKLSVEHWKREAATATDALAKIRAA